MKTLLLVLVFFLSINLFGQQVFLTDKMSKGDLKVYVSSDTTLSDVDLLVFITEDSSEVVKDGIWYYSKSEINTAFTIVYVKNKKKADIVISYVPSIDGVSWLKRDKSSPHKYKKSLKLKKAREGKKPNIVKKAKASHKSRRVKKERSTHKLNNVKKT